MAVVMEMVRRELSPLLTREHGDAEDYLIRCAGLLLTEEIEALTEIAVAMLRERGVPAPRGDGRIVFDGEPLVLA